MQCETDGFRTFSFPSDIVKHAFPEPCTRSASAELASAGNECRAFVFLLDFRPLTAVIPANG
jgi:hypothetical protein